MRKNILPPLTSLLFFMAVHAQAGEPPSAERHCPGGMHFYARVLGGANFLQNTTIDENKTSYRAGYIIDGSLGYCWRKYGLRVEGEYAFRRNAISKMDFVTGGSSNNGYLATSSAMANLLWDFPLCLWGASFWDIQPFVGAGVGCDFQKMHSSNSRIVFDQSWAHFSWQLMTGLSYPIFRNAEITMEYKFHQAGSHFYNQSVGVGLVYKFGFMGQARSSVNHSCLKAEACN